MRDAAFTVYAFLRIGFQDEAAAFMGWIEDYASKYARPKERGAVVFTINGDNQLPEHTLDHWEGYRGSSPVRIGNDAVSQFQGDIYGELMDAFYQKFHLGSRVVNSCPRASKLEFQSSQA
jgi:GH15 family glucan-1,4-alpha-glucosidase